MSFNTSKILYQLSRSARWRNASALSEMEFDSHTWAWLNDQQSLTQRLIDVSDGDFGRRQSLPVEPRSWKSCKPKSKCSLKAQSWLPVLCRPRFSFCLRATSRRFTVLGCLFENKHFSNAPRGQKRAQSLSFVETSTLKSGLEVFGKSSYK